jgi:hypothetical protein
LGEFEGLDSRVWSGGGQRGTFTACAQQEERSGLAKYLLLTDPSSEFLLLKCGWLSPIGIANQGR